MGSNIIFDNIKKERKNKKRIYIMWNKIYKTRNLWSIKGGHGLAGTVAGSQ